MASESASITTIWEQVDKTVVRESDAALAKYRAGMDEVSLDLGGLVIKLWDRKDNDNRETVRMSMEEFVNTIRMCHVNGAALAASAMAQMVAAAAGLKVIDDEEGKS